jgi:hypothetical protein
MEGSLHPNRELNRKHVTRLTAQVKSTPVVRQQNGTSTSGSWTTRWEWQTADLPWFSIPQLRSVDQWLFYIRIVGPPLGPLGTSATSVLLYLPRVIVMENFVGWRLAREIKYSEKTCPSATLSTTSSTWPDMCANPSRGGGKPATNRLSYGAASGYLRLRRKFWRSPNPNL